MTLTYEQEVLKAMLRLARRQLPATEEAVLLRVGGDSQAHERALSRLEAAGLVLRNPGQSPRITLAGLAVGVALRGRRTVREKSLPTRLAA